MKLSEAEIKMIEEECSSYREELYHHCLYRVNYDIDIAETCLQDTYLTLEEVLKSGKYEIANYHAWLYTVLTNNINKAMYQKNSRKFYEVPLSHCDENEKTLLTNIKDPTDVGEIVEEREAQKNLLKQVLNLKAEEKNLMIDYYFNDVKLVDIAAAENKSTNAIKKRHQRLKKKLRELFKDIPEFQNQDKGAIK